MARTPKPWWWKERQAWFVTIAGERHNLGPDRASATTAFHELMAKPRPVVIVPSKSVVGIIDTFLDWTQRYRAALTYDWYVARTSSFCKTLPAGLSVAQLKPFHVQQWVDGHPTWSDGTKRGSIVAVQRAFQWAVKQGHIERSPIAHFEKPRAGKRENVITATEYQTILSHVRDEEFRDLLITSWECGCRPQESLRVEARHVDLQNSRWVFPQNEAKGKKRIRIVYLTETAVAITKRLMLKHPDGPLFRNTEGAAWHPYAVNCRFHRLQTKIGRKLALYDFRHSFAQRLLEAGVDALVVATLLGHVDTSMLAKVYSHLTSNPKHLLEEMKRAAS